MRQRKPRQRNAKHLRLIRHLPCLVCGDDTNTEAAHIRYSDARYGKKNPGVGQKPDDAWAVPLCNRHHREQHAIGDEREFWKAQKINALFVARSLAKISAQYELSCKIIEIAQAGARIAKWQSTAKSVRENVERLEAAE